MVRLFTCCLVLVCASVISSVVAITNQELYEILKETSEDQDANDVSYYDDVAMDSDDDTLSFPGNAQDEADIEYLMSKVFGDMLNNDADNIDGTPTVGGASCRCRHDSCQCCVRKTWKVRIWRKKIKARLNACLKLEYLGRRNFGFRITFTVNGRRLYRKEISLKHPPSLCYRVPGLGKFAKICVELYNVNLRRKSVCVRLTGKLNLVFKRFRIRIKLGCFRIPIRNDDELIIESLQDTQGEDFAQQDATASFRSSQSEDLDQLDAKASFQNLNGQKDDDFQTSDDVFEQMIQ